MSVLATLILTLAGLALIAVAVSDIFRTILHVEARGALAHATMAALWMACRRRGRSVLVLAGPVGLLAVVAVWATLLILGWSLILWPHMEDGFARAASESSGFWDAVHVSIASLTTLGFSDVVPDEEWLRVVTPLEALLGFGLLSASIAYLLLIYPVLARRRSMAYELSLLSSAEDREGPLLEQLEEAPAERLFAELMSRLVVIERDTADVPAAYYFTERDERFSLAAQSRYLLHLARLGTGPDAPRSIRFRAQLLLDAVDAFARTSADRFPHIAAESTDDILAALAEDHLVSDRSRQPR